MTDINLNGLHILVTRPEAQALPWAKQLQELGASITLHPMLAIQPLDDSESKQAIKNTILRLDEYQKAIFVSQNAVSYGVPWVDEYWPQLPVTINILAIGSSTASLLKQQLHSLGAFHVDHFNDKTGSPQQAMNSEALLTIPALQNVEGEKILVFRGRGGRTHLGKSLEARGALVDYCELYQRLIPDTIDRRKIALFKESSEAPVTAVHSGETLNNLCAAVGADDLSWLRLQTLLVPGERVAKMARELGFKHILIAENATHESMIGALHDWRKR